MVEAVVAPVVDITMKSVKQSTGGKQPQHVEAVVAPVTELLTKMSKSVSSKKKQKTKLGQQVGQQGGLLHWRPGAPLLSTDNPGADLHLVEL